MVSFVPFKVSFIVDHDWRMAAILPLLHRAASAATTSPSAALVASHPPHSTMARRASSCPHLTAMAQRFAKFVGVDSSV